MSCLGCIKNFGRFAIMLLFLNLWDIFGLWRYLWVLWGQAYYAAANLEFHCSVEFQFVTFYYCFYYWRTSSESLLTHSLKHLKKGNICEAKGPLPTCPHNMVLFNKHKRLWQESRKHESLHINQEPHFSKGRHWWYNLLLHLMQQHSLWPMGI